LRFDAGRVRLRLQILRERPRRGETQSHAAEIVDQVLQVQKLSGEKVNNIVVMGMGEPLANYDNLLRALKIINAPWGLGIGARKITVSTVGLVPRIKQLADEPMQIRLAVSSARRDR
jgi:23S rRNA (adenine2503-C2)-methyltransferase